MNLPSYPRCLAPLLGVISVLSVSTSKALADSPCRPSSPVADFCSQCAVVSPLIISTEPSSPSWVFKQSTYSHDPATGVRVAQYMRKRPVEPLDDPRLVTSRYRRSRTSLRGADGSTDTYYEVQHWGNDRGGLDAQWERFHDAWKDSYLSGGYYRSPQQPWAYGGYPGGGYGWPGVGFALPGYGFPGHSLPGHGYPPGYGQHPHHHPGNGHGGHQDNSEKTAD